MYLTLITIFTAIAGTTSAGLCGSTFQANCADGSTQTPIEADSGICVPHVCANNGGAVTIVGNTLSSMSDCTLLEGYGSMDCSDAAGGYSSACDRGNGLPAGNGNFYSFIAQCD